MRNRLPMTAESDRLNENSLRPDHPWRRWGPYVSERSWGTVREDYSANGNAWDYFPHDQARSRAYRWGEDGLAGLCDRYQLLVFALGLWNGRDPILKERLFGLVPYETNHGEDVKEYYFYLDSSPTHSYLKYLYKYPQAAYPYCQLIERSRRSPHEPEYELLDTGIFDDDRYFDVFVEYAKSDPEDICIRIEVCNRGPEPAQIHVLPHLWFRNTWAWGSQSRPLPRIEAGPDRPGSISLHAHGAEPVRGVLQPYELGSYHLHAEPSARRLFTDNETNAERIWGPHVGSRSRFVKDAFHRHIIHGEACINPEEFGTKACFHHEAVVPARGSVVFRLRLQKRLVDRPLADVDAIMARRKAEADAFYAELHPPKATADEKLVQRQALAGMLWNKQIYLFNVHNWLEGDDPRTPPPESRKRARNFHWRHLNSMRVLSMPDKWEYPWFAAWDLAFHTIPLALVDPEFAKEQLWLLLFEQFQHPNGQIPAYEWEFSDLNPPVHAWAVWRVYHIAKRRQGEFDRTWLEKCFHKLLINFAWWVNKVDAEGLNVFEGGFLGLDNITVMDRSEPLPPGVTLKQSDATGWMGMFCLNLMRIALELAKENPAYAGLATKFFEHYVYIGAAMKRMSGRDYELWSERDGFFYDVWGSPDGAFHKLRVRSLVGLIPLFAIERLEADWIEPFPEYRANVNWFLHNRAHISQSCVTTIERTDGKRVHVLALVSEPQLRRVLARIWDPAEFRSPYGLRSLSKYHQEHPFVFGDRVVSYEPAEATTQIKGGNSNWRGPLWFPTTFLMIESLRKLATAYGPAFKLDSPVPGEPPLTLEELRQGLVDRMIAIFTRGKDGRRPVHDRREKFQTDPYWRDLILFYEYFHGDTGEGLGASHQTGWTGLVATLIDEWRR
jgi:hypothetical protein